jgi:hypothetical protein
MRPCLPPFACLLLICASGCQQRDPVADNANGASLPPPVRDSSHDPAGAPPANEAQAKPAVPPATVSIPAALHGRWGLTPADCTSTRGDAKGLLTISEDGLRFYESRAVPGADVQTDEESINGHFDFTGEGQTWSRYEAFEAKGNKLTRTETDPAESYTYAKC